jgi:hypothetical protein
MRIDGIYEADPELMQVFSQQDLPLWDSLRIVASRADHLTWMHSHFADAVLSGDALLSSGSS